MNLITEVKPEDLESVVTEIFSNSEKEKMEDHLAAFILDLLDPYTTKGSSEKIKELLAQVYLKGVEGKLIFPKLDKFMPTLMGLSIGFSLGIRTAQRLLEQQELKDLASK